MRYPADGQLSEADWQRRVIDYAQRSGWWVYHHADSRRASAAGLPDLICIRERVLWLELKTERGRVRPEQHRVIDLLQEAGETALVMRPSDWPDVMRLLGR